MQNFIKEAKLLAIVFCYSDWLNTDISYLFDANGFSSCIIEIKDILCEKELVPQNNEVYGSSNVEHHVIIKGAMSAEFSIA